MKNIDLHDDISPILFSMIRNNLFNSFNNDLEKILDKKLFLEFFSEFNKKILFELSDFEILNTIDIEKYLELGEIDSNLFNELL